MEFLHKIINFFTLCLKDPLLLIETVGYVGLILMVFAESGLLVGFFLPGDSLLFAAGLFASMRGMNIFLLGLILNLAAIFGNTAGFYIGGKLGPLLYKQKDSFLFKKKHIVAAHDFYNEHGGKTIILACFIPIIRAFVPAVAGAASMHYGRFITFNIIGSSLWVWSMLLSSYYLVKLFGDSISRYLHIIIIAIIVVSLLPLVIKWLKK